jgi:catechol 2,3-dioxygenase-like lactoylglutathione lyase family enzyme
MIHHVAVVVSDLEQNRKFYSQVLGLKEIPRESSNAVSPTGARFQMGECELHLQHRENNPQKTDQHFATIVENLDSVIQTAEKMGAKTKLSQPLSGFSKRSFVYDFDQNRIEVLQK